MSSTGTALDSAFGLLREVADFPKPGVLFRDLGPVLANGDALRALITALDQGIPTAVDVVAAVEARGFLLGAALAHARGLGVVGVRKPGKLPLVADRVDYVLEYGSATLELPEGVVRPGQRVVVVDDVLATGGTANAACELVERAGAVVAGVAVVLELAGLGGRERLAKHPLHVLLTV